MKTKMRNLVLIAMVFVMFFAMAVTVSAAESYTNITSVEYGNPMVPYFTLNEEVAFCGAPLDMAPENGTIFEKGVNENDLSVLDSVFVNAENSAADRTEMFYQVMQQAIWSKLDDTNDYRQRTREYLGRNAVRLFDELTAESSDPTATVGYQVYLTDANGVQFLVIGKVNPDANWNPTPVVHVHSYVKDSKAATCTEDGYETFSCDCGDSYTNVLPAFGHTASEPINATPAYCTEDGYTGDIVCTTCNAVLETGTVIPATGHNMIVDEDTPATCVSGSHYKAHCANCNYCEIAVTSAHGHTYGLAEIKESTCTEPGYKKCSCTKCDATYFFPFPVLGHTPSDLVNVAPATCTEDGYTGDIVCTTCNAVLETGTVIPATGHNYAITDSKDATCTVNGYETFTCAKCGDAYTVIVPAIGHTPSDLVNVAPATCTEDGYTGDIVCTVCGEVLEAGAVIPATGHDYAITDSKDATCTVNGYETFTCAKCGDAYMVIVPAIGHTPSDLVNVAPATCTEDGYTGDIVCTVCGEILEAGAVIPATGHDYESEVTREPTSEEEGEITYTCENCGDTHTEVIPVLEFIEEPTEEPAEDPTEEPAEEPTEEPTEEPIKEPTEPDNTDELPADTADEAGEVLADTDDFTMIPKLGDTGVSLGILTVLMIASSTAIVVVIPKKKED